MVAATEPRRCFLFAGYSRDGAIDEIDVHHIAHLSSLGDVHCYMDTATLSGDGLNAVRAYAQTINCSSHGEYDFGSWKRLISFFGSNLNVYDYIFLVNSSSILLGDLRPFLASFENSSADFFAGLLLDEDYVGPIVSVADYLYQNDEQVRSVMMPSNFWGFRPDLFNSAWVQSLFAGVKHEVSRIDVAYHYERRFTRSVFRHGVSYHLFINQVFRYSSLYTEDAFKLLELGYPYLKRKILGNNFYRVDFLDARIKRLRKRIDSEAETLLARTLKSERKGQL